MCATPDKVAYTSKRAAKRALHGIPHPHGLLRAYFCGQHWHLGHGDALTVARPARQRRRERGGGNRLRYAAAAA